MTRVAKELQAEFNQLRADGWSVYPMPLEVKGALRDRWNLTAFEVEEIDFALKTLVAGKGSLEPAYMVLVRNRIVSGMDVSYSGMKNIERRVRVSFTKFGHNLMDAMYGIGLVPRVKSVKGAPVPARQFGQFQLTLLEKRAKFGSDQEGFTFTTQSMY